MQSGSQSIVLENKPFIYAAANVAGKKESEGPLGKLYDKIIMDDMCGGQSFEEGESILQKECLSLLLEKSKLDKEDIRYVFAGDLLGQLIATSFGVMDYEIPLFGVYGACSTFGESMGLGAMSVNAGYGQHVVAMASSHFGSAERQFRFPSSYGSQRPLSSTWTVTGAGGVIISSLSGFTKARISSVTTGKVIDYDVHDSMNMGACMAPAAADTIVANMKDLGVGLDEYDKVITGDLGSVGHVILCDLLYERGIDLKDKHMDCGTLVYSDDYQGTSSGGSGCGCSAIVFTSMIIDNINRGEWNKILFVPTGALLSPVSFNEGRSVPGIAHGVVIERG